MITHVLSEQPLVPIRGTSLYGRPLTTQEDNVGFEAYEISGETGDTLELSPIDDKTNHCYYCIKGCLKVQTPDGATFDVVEDSVLALPANTIATGIVGSTVRLFVVYREQTLDEGIPKNPLFRLLSEIVGTERDVDWTNGRSRRYLVKEDGFNTSLHNTLAYKGKKTAMQYNNHLELAYYFKGKLTYSWDNGEKSQFINVVKEGDGTALVIDQHDSHVAKVDEDSFAICVFNPTLIGNETHDVTKSTPSSF